MAQRLPLRPHHRRAAELETSVYGTVPLYLTNTAHTLYGSWWLPDLAPRLSSERLCDRGVARLLTRQQPYTSETPFTGVWQLTERARALFTFESSVVSYPEPATHVLQARDVAPEVDVVEAFEGLLAESLTHRLPQDSVGIELSSPSNCLCTSAGERGSCANGFPEQDFRDRWRTRSEARTSSQ